MTSTAIPRRSRPITVIGLGADGLAGLPEHTRALVLAAGTILGGPRHLALLPEVTGQVRVPWPSPLRAGLPGVLAEHAEVDLVALASGDPLVSGIAGTLIDLLGADSVRVEPAVSSVALARARLGWSHERVEVISLVGRDPHLVLRQLAPGHRVLVLSSDATTPSAIAGLLTEAGYGASQLTVLGDLGSQTESRTTAAADAWSTDPARVTSALNIVGIELDGPVLTGWAAGLPDEVFEHDGQLTKRDLRASAMARLTPLPGQLLWDVGAGAGSVGIEWLRAHPTCRAIAVESDSERATRIAGNAERLGVPTLVVVKGRAPDALAELPAPDAVFIGGGVSRPGVLDACLAALKPGGRLVAHAVTLESEAALIAAYARHGGELTRISVEQAAPVGTFTGWTPARSVTQWALVR